MFLEIIKKKSIKNKGFMYKLYSGYNSEAKQSHVRHKRLTEAALENFRERGKMNVPLSVVLKYQPRRGACCKSETGQS